MHRPGDQWGRGRGARGPGGRGPGGRGAGDALAATLAAARDAKDTAAGAFYEMDQAQRFVAGRVTLLSDLDPDGAAPARSRLEQLAAAADATAAAYIQLVDTHDLDAVSGPGGRARTVADYDGIRRAFGGVTERLTHATADLNAFAASIGPQIERLESALDELPARLTAARDAIAEAERAIEAARAFNPAEPQERLTAARQAFQLLGSEGLGGLGLAGALAKADEVRRLALEARDAAIELPRLGEKIQHDLVAIRTRVEVVAGRAGPVAEAMRQLRRRFTQPCWQDLGGAEGAITEAVERARERIAEAGAAAAGQEWARARGALTAARTELNAADRQAGRVTGRLADLDAAVADPAAPAEAARFAVRDAQRLAMAGPSGPAPAHARTLDALVARLDAAVSRLQTPRPDYWAYLRELNAITTAAKDVVGMIRAERAQH